MFQECQNRSHLWDRFCDELIARWVGIVSTACIRSVGSCTDRSSSNAYRDSAAYGRTTIDTTAIDTSVMDTTAIDTTARDASTTNAGAISKGVT